MRRIATIADLEAGVSALCSLDPRLAAVRERTVPLPMRDVKPGFASLVAIIVSQQVSKVSAAAIYGRLAVLLDPLTPASVLAADDALFREAGLSRPKVRTLRALAEAAHAGALDLEAVAELPAEEAIAAMTRVHGVGRWTAEVYLLFATGHPDVFPARDVALQSAVGQALGLEKRPSERDLARIALAWAPLRGVAAHLFWAYYAVLKGWDAAPDARSR